MNTNSDSAHPTEHAESQPNELERLRTMAQLLREMAMDKPDMKLMPAAAVLLGGLRPITEDDIKRGQEIAARRVKPNAESAPGQQVNRPTDGKTTIGGGAPATYEYIRVTFDFGDLAQMNQLASVGWRVISVLEWQGMEVTHVALMERALAKTLAGAAPEVEKLIEQLQKAINHEIDGTVQEWYGDGVMPRSYICDSIECLRRRIRNLIGRALADYQKGKA